MTDQRTFSIAFLEETVISLMFYVLLQWFIMITFQRVYVGRCKQNKM